MKVNQTAVFDNHDEEGESAHIPHYLTVKHPHDETIVVPFGEEDVNLWSAAVPDDVEVPLHLPVQDDTANEASSRSAFKKMSVSLCSVVELVKYIYSSVLIIFCIAVVTAAVFNKQTTATAYFGLPPGFVYPFFWFLLLWLALMEGGLNCMVGLQPVDKALYEQTHPRTYKCTSLGHKGDNMERFIVGRQLLDLLCIFVTNFLVSAIANASVFGMSTILNEIFLGAGLAIMLITIVFGQLTTQINAAHCMLDFIDNYAMVVVTYLAMAVEASGLLHAVYLIQILFAKLTGKEIETKEVPRSTLRKLWFWGRVTLSTCLLILCTFVIMVAIFDGKTSMWKQVPPVASLLILLFLIFFTGFMESLQIAFMSVVHLPEAELQKHEKAHKLCQYVFRGQNLQTFLIGRQIFQTVVMFLIARITTVDADNENLLGVSDGLQKFFNTGLVGTIFSTILASLAWRVLASTFPIAFLSNPFAWFIVRFCIMVELTGICSTAWIVAALHKKCMGYKPDEHYIGKGVILVPDASSSREEGTDGQSSQEELELSTDDVEST